MQIITAESAKLTELGDVPIDDVIALAKRDLGYRDLYYEWERQRWEAGALDFAPDAHEWRSIVDAASKGSFRDGLAWSFVGARCLAETLVPLVDAAPTEEQQVFLSTQAADLARHLVFMDRFYVEVLDDPEPDMESRSVAEAKRLDESSRTLLFEMLPAASRAVRERPDDLDRTVEGIALHHLVLGTLTLTIQRALIEQMRELGLLLGFRRGATAAVRDTTRHIAFATRFLKESISVDGERATVIEETVNRTRPYVTGALDPGGPFAGKGLLAYASKAVEERLRVIGLDVAP